MICFTYYTYGKFSFNKIICYVIPACLLNRILCAMFLTELLDVFVIMALNNLGKVKHQFCFY